MNPRGFASDNYAGAHPEVLAALAAVNHGHAPAYGDDEHTARAHARFRARCSATDARAVPRVQRHRRQHHLPRSLCRPWEAVICAATAHLNVDECGGTRAVGGFKLLTIATPDGKLTPELVRHASCASATSTPPSRASSRSPSPRSSGTLYSPPRSARWPTGACARPLPARRRRALANAAAACDVPLGAMTTTVSTRSRSAAPRSARSASRLPCSCAPASASTRSSSASS